jgi:hypothetical protein
MEKYMLASQSKIKIKTLEVERKSRDTDVLNIADDKSMA